jgi:hypothetical protein
MSKHDRTITRRKFFTGVAAAAATTAILGQNSLSVSAASSQDEIYSHPCTGYFGYPF